MKSALIFLVFAGAMGGYAGQEACTIDAEKFCSGFTPGGEQVRKCLKDHVHELSPDCKDYHADKGKEVFNKIKKTGKKGVSIKAETKAQTIQGK